MKKTETQYLLEKQNIEIEQKTLENKIAELSTYNKEIEITLEYLLDLVSRVNSLYKSSRIDKKRRILNLVFSNFFLNGSNPSYELKRPFDLFIKRSNRLLNWEKVVATRNFNYSEIKELLPEIKFLLENNNTN